MRLSLQGCAVMQGGRPLEFDREALRRELKRETIRIAIDLESGSGFATAWGCDLSKKYVDINAEYST
jgi:glutamate N-acetyltransferase/amino-acid N-acetyltransferase